MIVNAPPTTWQDTPTFEAMYHRLVPSCHRLVGRIWRSTAMRWHIPTSEYHELVTDAVHDALVEVREHPYRFDETRGTLRNWIVLIAQRKLRKQLQFITDRLAHHADLDARPERPPVPSRTVARRVDDTLALVLQRHAAVLQARYFQQRSVRAIADDLAVAEDQAKAARMLGDDPVPDDDLEAPDTLLPAPILEAIARHPQPSLAYWQQVPRPRQEQWAEGIAVDVELEGEAAWHTEP